MPRPPHAVLVVENLPVPLDRRVWNEATALRDAGWRVTVIGPLGSGSMRALRERIDGIGVLRYPIRPAHGALGYPLEYLAAMAGTGAWLAWLRAQGKIDVLHGCNPPDLFWIYGRLIAAGGGAYVYDQHEPVPELFEAKFGGSSPLRRALGSFVRCLERASYRSAEAVLTVNESMRELVMRRSGLDGDRVDVLWNAPDLSAYQALAGGRAPAGLGVCYVGVMNTQDGLDLLLEAWRHVILVPGLDGAHLHLVGDGEARASLERQASRLGITGSVTFHGFLSAPQYIPILSGCLFGVSPDPPSSFNQLATMVKVIDYMAIGRGTVAFDLAETNRLAGPSAVIVQPATPEALAAAIARLLRHPDEAAALGRAGADRIESMELDWATSARRLVARYAGIVASRGAAGSRPIPR